MLKTNTLYNIDAIEGLKKLKNNSVDLIVTDPPYNIASKNKTTFKGGKLISTQQAWGQWDSFHPFDYDVLIMQLLSQCYRVLKPGGSFYMFSSNEDNGCFIHKAIERRFTYRNQLAMVKKNPQPSLSKKNWRFSFEVCMYLVKEKAKTFNFISQQECVNNFQYGVGRKITTHPTEKPLAFIKRLVQVSSNAGDLVVDPFMGSGTTAVACKELDRKFIGFDTNKDYVKMAVERLRDKTQRRKVS